MSIKNIFNPNTGGTVEDAGGGGATGDWINLTPSDLTVDLGDYTTFTLGSSSESGFTNHVQIGCDTGRTVGQLDLTKAGIVAFDTGINLDSLSNGDGNSIIIQFMFEPKGVNNTSDYYTDATHEHSITNFCTITGPPYSAGVKGYLGGGCSFRGTTTTLPYYFATRITRNNVITATSGVYWGFADPLKNLVSTVTVAKFLSGSNPALSLSQMDFNGYIDDSGEDELLATVLQTTDGPNSNTTSSSDNVFIGIAFEMNETTDATVIKNWHFNLKYRILQIS